MSHLVAFEPGDMTRYVMHLVELPEGPSPLGYSSHGYAVLSILNMGVCVALPLDAHVMFSDLAQKWPKANPWTIRAALLFLRREAAANSWPMTVTLEGCPVGE